MPDLRELAFLKEFEEHVLRDADEE
jgi:hypothetical protein